MTRGIDPELLLGRIEGRINYCREQCEYYAGHGHYVCEVFSDEVEWLETLRNEIQRGSYHYLEEMKDES